MMEPLLGRVRRCGRRCRRLHLRIRLRLPSVVVQSPRRCLARQPSWGCGRGFDRGARDVGGGCLSLSAYGYGGAMPALPQGLFGPSVIGAFPFAPGPLASPLVGPVGADAMVGVTAPSLLAAVAMRRGQPQGQINDQEAEDFLYDALELLPGAADVEIRCEGGRVTLTGSVQHKRVKRDVGEIAWAIPGLNDVQNNVTIASPARVRRAVAIRTPARQRKQGERKEVSVGRFDDSRFQNCRAVSHSSTSSGCSEPVETRPPRRLNGPRCTF